MKQIRKRLTYANVVSSIAVFLVLGGATAFAATASKIGTSQIKANAVTTGKIKKEAVTTSKIKKDAVTGAKVNESTLGQVPSAVNADHANTASALSSPVVQPFKFFANGTTTATILAVTGAVFEGSCVAGELSFTGTHIRGTANDGITKVEGVNEGQEAFNNSDDDLDGGNTTPLLNELITEVGATADYMGAGGNPNVSVNYASEEQPGSFIDVGAECVIWGTAQTP